MKPNTLLLATLGLLLCAAGLQAQPPQREGRFRGRGGPDGAQQQSPVDQLMQYDTNNDGVLTTDEVTDRGLQRQLAQADTNTDGQLTAAELTAFFDQQAAGAVRGRINGQGPQAPRGPPPGGDFGGLPRPGQILPGGLQQALNLSADQQAQLAALQQQIDAELANILTAEQLQQLQQMAQGRGQMPQQRGQFAQQRGQMNQPPEGRGVGPRGGGPNSQGGGRRGRPAPDN